MTPIEIIAKVLIDYHKQQMSTEEQIKRIEIADSEGSNIMLGHQNLREALRLQQEMFRPYLRHKKFCDVDYKGNICKHCGMSLSQHNGKTNQCCNIHVNGWLDQTYEKKIYECTCKLNSILEV